MANSNKRNWRLFCNICFFMVFPSSPCTLQLDCEFLWPGNGLNGITFIWFSERWLLLTLQVFMVIKELLFIIMYLSIVGVLYIYVDAKTPWSRYFGPIMKCCPHPDTDNTLCKAFVMNLQQGREPRGSCCNLKWSLYLEQNGPDRWNFE